MVWIFVVIGVHRLAPICLTTIISLILTLSLGQKRFVLARPFYRAGGSILEPASTKPPGPTWLASASTKGIFAGGPLKCPSGKTGTFVLADGYVARQHMWPASTNRH